MELTNEFEVPVPIDEAWAVLTDIERIAPCLPGAQLQGIDGDEYRGIVKVKVGPITAQYKGTARFVERDDRNYRAVVQASGRDTRGQGNASATISAQLVPKDHSTTQVDVLTDLNVTGKVAQFGRGVIADVSAKLLAQFVENLEQRVLAGERARSEEVEMAENEPNAGNGSASAPADEAELVAKVKVAQAASGAKKATKKTAKIATKQTAAGADSEEANQSSSAGDGPTEDGDAAAASPPADGERRAVSGEQAVDHASSAPAGADATIEAAEASGPRPAHRVESPEPEPVDLLETAGSPVLKRALPLLGLAAAVAVLMRLVRRRRRG
ncbi:MAG: SRPBCC family protein [Acidimicrobiales bacterium]|nr:SRPBCC family protein [Acidimicrobiales bacterium]